MVLPQQKFLKLKADCFFLGSSERLWGFYVESWASGEKLKTKFCFIAEAKESSTKEQSFNNNGFYEVSNLSLNRFLLSLLSGDLRFDLAAYLPNLV